ncbi:MAG: alkyl/aryl-sulfatase [Burkholderiaceae bacterium]
MTNQSTKDLGQPMKLATAQTCEANRAVSQALDLDDPAVQADANQGFIRTIPDARITRTDGSVVWDLSVYRFLEEEAAPDSVNPSLWRQARLNRLHGLYKVTDRVYQVRGFDLANMTIIEGDSGLILIDPLMYSETAAAALALYREERGDRPVHTVIYSHSHPDHYGGVEGVMTPEDAAQGRIAVIAPNGFLEEAISETMIAGVPMRRRSLFQFGPMLPAGPLAHVDSGLGKRVGRGTTSLIAPTRVISEPFEAETIDGIDIQYQLTPGAEAPAEMNFYFPQFRVLNLAENGCQTMHNLCPLRGAKTRDSLAWSKYLGVALERFVDQTDVVIAQHHWPTFGTDRIRRFVTEQRDLYRFLHDQTLRRMSHGQTPDELAEGFDLPSGLVNRAHARPYYGAFAHNLRAIYSHYLGPFDGHPAHLHPLPPDQAACRYVEYMGGTDALLDKASKDYEQGSYRWVLQVVYHAVFADPTNQRARDLCADTMEQLGYQSESSTWRNAYLQGAAEMRRGAPKAAGGAGVISARVAAMMPVPMVLDFLAIRLNGDKADGLSLHLDWVMTDEQSKHRLTLSNAALSHAEGSHSLAADASLMMNRDRLREMMNKGGQVTDQLGTDAFPVEGDLSKARALFECFDAFDPMFNIVEP